MKLSVGNASEIDDQKGVKYVNSQIDIWRASPVGGHRRDERAMIRCDTLPPPTNRVFHRLSGAEAENHRCRQETTHTELSRRNKHRVGTWDPQLSRLR